jgi:hypothetical protein
MLSFRSISFISRRWEYWELLTWIGEGVTTPVVVIGLVVVGIALVVIAAFNPTQT